MSQKGDAVGTSSTPAAAVKGIGKGMGAVLIALVCVGAFAGAGAGTYLTFRNGILPSFQASNGNNSNNNNCTTNCNNGGSNRCTSNCQSGNWSAPSDGVPMTITKHEYKKN